MDENEAVDQDQGSPTDTEVEKSESKSVTSAPERLGAVEKCPVCGSHVDADAYHCPTCRNTFCFHCRARILPADSQFQCVSQQCEYYGKLLCDICEDAVEEDLPPAVYLEPQEGYWPLLLIAFLAAAWYIWSWLSLETAMLCVLIGFPLIGYLLHLAGLNIFGKKRRVEHLRKSRFHRCICCDQRVKEIATNTAFPNSWYGAGTAEDPLNDESLASLQGDDQ